MCEYTCTLRLIKTSLFIPCSACFIHVWIRVPIPVLFKFPKCNLGMNEWGFILKLWSSINSHHNLLIAFDIFHHCLLIIPFSSWLSCCSIYITVYYFSGSFVGFSLSPQSLNTAVYKMWSFLLYLLLFLNDLLPLDSKNLQLLIPKFMSSQNSMLISFLTTKSTCPLGCLISEM